MDASSYPCGPVRLIDPFGAGGGPDLVARAISHRLAELWGQPVTVENHPGIGSTAGPALVAQSPPDGHTLLVNTSAHAYSAVFRANLPYDPLRDFTPVAPISSQPYVLVAAAHTGWTTLPKLVAAAQARPGWFRFGSSGVGTATHVGVAKLNAVVQIEALHEPASGADAISDTIGRVVAGETDYAMSPISIALPYIRAGTLIGLGVTTTRRSRLLRNVPTLAEAGAPGFDFPIWYGLWAPARTPTHVVVKLANGIASVLQESALRDRLAEHDAEPLVMARTDFDRFVQSESEVAARILEAAGSPVTQPLRRGEEVS